MDGCCSSFPNILNLFPSWIDSDGGVWEAFLPCFLSSRTTIQGSDGAGVNSSVSYISSYSWIDLTIGGSGTTMTEGPNQGRVVVLQGKREASAASKSMSHSSSWTWQGLEIRHSGSAVFWVNQQDQAQSDGEISGGTDIKMWQQG